MGQLRMGRHNAQGDWQGHRSVRHQAMPMLSLKWHVREEAREPAGVLGYCTCDVAALDKPPVAHQCPLGMREHRLSNPVSLVPPSLRTVFGTQGWRQLRRFSQREDDVGLVSQFIGILEGALPELAPVMDHARVVSELRLQGALHHLNEQLAMLAEKGVIACPIPVAAKQVEQLTRLVKLLAVGRVEALGNHGHTVFADHLVEDVLENVARRLELSGMQGPQGGFGAVANPLTAVHLNYARQ